jgi:lipopolysaccharide export system protein LptA
MFLKSLSAMLMLAISSHAFSLESDAEAEITIQSDSADFSRKTGTAIYVGNVVLEQGTLLIKADKITLYSDESQRLNKAIAIGQPAHFQQQMEGDKGLTKAQGETITYLTQEKTITLLDDAFLEQEGNSFSGKTINYDMIEERITANGEKSTPANPSDNKSDGRIKMIIQPAKSAEIINNEDA